MLLTIPERFWHALSEEGQRCYPEECCGLLVGVDSRVTRVIPSANIAPQPQQEFLLDPLLQLEWQRVLRGSGEHIIGIYHSHPEGEATLSTHDMKTMRSTPVDMVWLVLSVRHGVTKGMACHRYQPDKTDPESVSFVIEK